MALAQGVVDRSCLDQASRNICAELNRFTDLSDALRIVLGYVSDVTTCEAIAIRLHTDGDYPYYVYNGFTDSFIQAENSLCARDASGCRVPRADGEGFELDCMCGNVIHHTIDPSQPFVTKGGSFWSNHTTALLAETTEEDRQGRTRNRCNGDGYESVALIPIRAGSEILGLLQVNDARIGCFTLDLIEFLESIGRQVGLAVQNSLVHEKLKNAAAKLEATNRQLRSEIGKRRKAERALAKTVQRLQRSNAELSQFAYVASHDLQEPLRTISSFVQLIETRYSEQADDKGLEYIHFTVDAARRMKTLIDDLLELSRVETTSQNFAPTSSVEAVHQVLGLLSESIRETGAEVVIPGDLPRVDADPTQLAQLFQNLIGNAIKFRRAEVPPRIEIRADRVDDLWTFQVSDNGIGLDLANVDRIFKMFQRLHARDAYPGTGIGLAICRKIVERHGGRIWVESEPGQGSTFSFTLASPAPTDSSQS
ncbi:MAG: ATP-binding protein [Pseudomonadota bacterium]